jgi:hypothetical protein
MRRQSIDDFVPCQATHRANALRIAHHLKDSIHAGGRGGRYKDALAPRRSPSDDLGNDPRLTGGRQSLNEADIRRVQGLSHCFTLCGVECGMLNRSAVKDAEVLRLSGDHTG